MVEEAPEGTQLETIHVPLERELDIFREEFGRKGRLIRGLGAFPRLDSSSSSTAASKPPHADKWEQMETNMVKVLQELENVKNENAELKAQMRIIFASKAMNPGSSGSNQQRDDDIPNPDGDDLR